MKLKYETVNVFDKVETSVTNPMSIPSYPCNYTVPASGLIDGYGGVLNSTCQHCDAMCTKSVIDSTINWFDGFDTDIIKIVYGIIGGLTVIL